jgi:hypothetical protein
METVESSLRSIAGVKKFGRTKAEIEVSDAP